MLKKLLLVFLMLGVLVSSSVAVCAEENVIVKEDSKTFRDDVMDKLNDAMDKFNVMDDVVLRVYNVAVTFAFAEYQDIDSILKSEAVLEEFYAVKKYEDTYMYLIEEEGEFVRTNLIRGNDRAVKMCETGEVTAYIAPDVVVYNTYCLSGETSHMGTAIYYETNKGDYVYFSHSAVGERLFPVAAFCAYTKALMDEAAKQPPDSVGSPIYDVWDLSPYDFRADTFNLNAKIPEPNSANSRNVENNSRVIAAVGACLLIAAIAGGFVYRRKRSNVLE